MLGAEYTEWMEQMLSRLKEKQFAYLIERKAHHKNYFFYDIHNFDLTFGLNEKQQVIWTPFQRQAALFDTEEQVEEFQSQYITPRKSSIIRIVKPPAMIVMLYG